MSKIQEVFGCIFLLLLTNNGFCMLVIGDPEINSSDIGGGGDPEFAFLPRRQLISTSSLDNIIWGSISSRKFEFKVFQEIISAYCCSRFSYLSNSTWMDGENPFCMQYESFFANWVNFIDHKIFYAQKLFIDPKMKLITISDIHADLDSLQAIFSSMINAGYIDENLIIKDDYFFIGLGDYVDRGNNTSLHLLTLMIIIALKNPGKVILLRGNHEDLNLNLLYKIEKEIAAVFGKNFSKKTYELLVTLYELMPSALYVSQTNPQKEGNDFLIFSHALLDFKFDSKCFLDFNNSELMSKGGTCFCAIRQNIFGGDDLLDSTPLGHGFVWHDVGVEHSSTIEKDDLGRYKYDPVFIDSFCKRCSSEKNVISGMVGGHEHNFTEIVRCKNSGKKRSSAGFVKVVSYPSSVCVEDGLLGDGENCLVDKVALCRRSLDCFTIVKVISSPLDRYVYKPTYLIISRSAVSTNSADATWIYKVVECN